MFGEVLRRRPDTPPDALVLRIIEPKQFTSAATEWGKETEAIALQEYEVNLKSLGHSDITVCRAGFVVCESHPFLGASPDGYVHDPSRKEQYGLVEIKCPYKYREVSVEDACKNSDFCSNITVLHYNGNLEFMVYKLRELNTGYMRSNCYCLLFSGLADLGTRPSHRKKGLVTLHT